MPTHHQDSSFSSQRKKPQELPGGSSIITNNDVVAGLPSAPPMFQMTSTKQRTKWNNYGSMTAPSATAAPRQTSFTKHEENFLVALKKKQQQKKQQGTSRLSPPQPAVSSSTRNSDIVNIFSEDIVRQKYSQDYDDSDTDDDDDDTIYSSSSSEGGGNYDDDDLCLNMSSTSDSYEFDECDMSRSRRSLISDMKSKRTGGLLTIGEKAFLKSLIYSPDVTDEQLETVRSVLQKDPLYSSSSSSPSKKRASNRLHLTSGDEEILLHGARMLVIREESARKLVTKDNDDEERNVTSDHQDVHENDDEPPRSVQDILWTDRSRQMSMVMYHECKQLHDKLITKRKEPTMQEETENQFTFKPEEYEKERMKSFKSANCTPGLADSLLCAVACGVPGTTSSSNKYIDIDNSIRLMENSRNKLAILDKNGINSFDDNNGDDRNDNLLQLLSKQQYQQLPIYPILGTDINDRQCYPHVMSPPIMDSLRRHLPIEVGEDNYWLKYSMVRDGASMRTLVTKIRSCVRTIIAIETTNGDVFGSFTSSPWRPHGNTYYGSGEAFLWKLRNKRTRDCSSSNDDGTDDDDDGTIQDLVESEFSVDVYPWSKRNYNIQNLNNLDSNLVIGGGDANDDCSAARPTQHHNKEEKVGTSDESEEYTIDLYESFSKSNDECDQNGGNGGLPGLTIDHTLSKGTSNKCTTFDSPPLLTTPGSVFDILNIEVWTWTPVDNIQEAKRLEYGRQFIFDHGKFTI